MEKKGKKLSTTQPRVKLDLAWEGKILFAILGTGSLYFAYRLGGGGLNHNYLSQVERRCAPYLSLKGEKSFRKGESV